MGDTPDSGEESGGCLGHLRRSPWGSLNGRHAAQLKWGRNVKKGGRVNG